MFIQFNTEDLTQQDRAVLRVLAGDAPTFPPPPPLEGEVSVTPTKDDVVERTTKAKTKTAEQGKAVQEAQTKALVEPEPEPEAANEGDGATMEDAVRVATEYVSSGRAADVKKALNSVGANRVSELGDDDIAGFLTALQE